MTIYELPEQERLNLEKLVSTFRKPMFIEARAEIRAKTENLVALKVREATNCLTDSQQELKSFRVGQPQGSVVIASALRTYMGSVGLNEQERLTSEIYVISSFSGEWIKGMQIVLAELGIKDFSGTAPELVPVSVRV